MDIESYDGCVVFILFRAPYEPGAVAAWACNQLFSLVSLLHGNVFVERSLLRLMLPGVRMEKNVTIINSRCYVSSRPPLREQPRPTMTPFLCDGENDGCLGRQRATIHATRTGRGTTLNFGGCLTFKTSICVPRKSTNAEFDEKPKCMLGPCRENSRPN